MNSLFSLALDCLQERDIEIKLERTRDVSKRIQRGEVLLDPVSLPDMNPGRPDRPKMIAPQELPRRKLTSIEGRAAMIHSFAHIEFNAINLAWDIICRFQTLPLAFYQDWAQVANEEASHFELLHQRLLQLGYEYGSFPAHAGLWKMAEDTAHDILLRLAVVPRILEARGLDVTPDLIHRFQEISDMDTAAILRIIYRDEIGHVNIGSQWFRYICEERRIEPDETFREIFQNFAPRGRNKLNREARIKAGFSQSELDSIM